MIRIQRADFPLLMVFRHSAEQVGGVLPFATVAFGLLPTGQSHTTLPWSSVYSIITSKISAIRQDLVCAVSPKNWNAIGKWKILILPT